ncbi:carbohydrate kinase [Promicromonospora citrea]|uniref:Ribokinase n=1 Tax=Promicromonospora citrea TaxID=43677 RepID=A0A8H9L2T0_9MICO|nr:carbohydrate kinase [Promicromonospora citrea]NNH50926.1 carbohydrate kinase [Promicromonospora citrea]GGM15379.1 ribokinase [Promicromonospora citrea]
MTGHVLAVGEALVDQVRRPDGSTADHPGGSIANVALTLGRLGRRVRLATWLGRDERGDLVRGWLAESDVRLVDGSDGAERTSVAAATLDENGSATYDFDLTWQVPDAARPEDGGSGDDGPTLAVHTGSIAAMLEPGAGQVRGLLESARSSATTTYDPNARPAIMGDAAEVRPRVEELVALSDVVKVSDEDLEWLYPGTDPVEVARRWQAGTPALVVVTLGGKGAVAVSAGGEVEVQAPRVEVVDTVGAGDSFMGALIDGLWEHDLLGAARRDALRSVDAATVRTLLEGCVAVAAVTVSRAGANPPRREEISA